MFSSLMVIDDDNVGSRFSNIFANNERTFSPKFKSLVRSADQQQQQQPFYFAKLN